MFSMSIIKKIFKIFKKNDIVYHILDEIRICIPEKYLSIYGEQINYIDKIIWVLDKEVDLYFSKDYPLSLNIEQFDETKISNVNITDIFGKKYIIQVYFVNGHIFSLESNLPFKGLMINEIQEMKFHCFLQD